MGANRSIHLWAVLGWLWLSLATPTLADDFPELPSEQGAAGPNAIVSAVSTPHPAVPTGSVKGWAEAVRKDLDQLGVSQPEPPRIIRPGALGQSFPVRLNQGIKLRIETPTPVPPSTQGEPIRLTSGLPEPPPAAPVTATLTSPDLAPKPAETTQLAPPAEAEPSPVASSPASEPMTPPVAAPLEVGPAPVIGAATETDFDPVRTQDEAKARLEKMPANKSKEATPATTALRALLEERVELVKNWLNAVAERGEAEKAESSPDKVVADSKADLGRVTATLGQTVKDPDALLPPSFHKAPAPVSETDRAEMKEAIDAAKEDLDEWTAKLDKLRARPAPRADLAIAAIRATRDKARVQFDSLKARNLEREAAVASAKTEEAREAARESLINGRWEARVENERLKTREARLAIETRRAEFTALNLQVIDGHIQVARRTLDLMKQRYQAIATVEERGLRQAAAKEEKRAEHSNDPVERYKASRNAELLVLESRVVLNENALTTDPSPTFAEEHALAERAREALAASRKLLDDGKISHLDALRLNADFRRLGADRTRIVRRDLAITADRLTQAENSLSTVETELVYDSRDDRFELDNLLERVPKAEHPKAEKAFKEFEARHLALLNRRRAALDKIARRAEDTHHEVLVRIHILDDHFGFIRTHMFWVRDEEPVGLATIEQAQRELRRLGRAFFKIGAEAGDRSAWGHLSAEFLAASIGLVVFPWPLRRAHRALQKLAPPATSVATNLPQPGTDVHPGS